MSTEGVSAHRKDNLSIEKHETMLLGLDEDAHDVGPIEHLQEGTLSDLFTDWCMDFGKVR